MDQVWRACAKGSQHSWYRVQTNTAQLFLKVNLVQFLDHFPATLPTSKQKQPFHERGRSSLVKQIHNVVFCLTLTQNRFLLLAHALPCPFLSKLPLLFCAVSYVFSLGLCSIPILSFVGDHPWICLLNPRGRFGYMAHHIPSGAHDNSLN